ncbi:MAG: pilus assembly protein [Maledivibacter sp.]|jgi:Flp pilus assembly protein TadG|nr:pilus assembly protein [Maledivibacter sp.]
MPTRKLLKSKKGQAMVEMAIVIPILLIILMGIFEFGRIFNTYIILTNASREGARRAALGASDTEVNEKINNAVLYLDSTNLTTLITPSKSSRKRGSEVKINIQYDVDIIAPIIDTIIPNPFHLETQTVMRVE